jgi:FkbH-like protein
VAIVALRLEELAPALANDFLGLAPSAVAELAAAALEQVITMTRRVRADTRALVLVHNFVTPGSLAGGLGDPQDPGGQLNTVRRMNLDLAEAVSELDGVHVLDADHTLAQVGLRQSTDARGARMSDAPFSVPALRALAEMQVRHLLAVRGPSVKCVVLDCDNTLWGGVVGEDGISRIALGSTGAGRRHRDLQQQLLDLRRRGVLLAIASKNEPEDVLEVLRTHPDCLLRETDFAAMRIDWEDKAENIASIAAELNLGIEHLVFIDDNPVECEWVKRRLPETRVVQWPGDLGAAGSLDDLAIFDSLLITDEDRARTAMYRAEGRRRAARQEATSAEDYLRSLEIVATVGRTGPQHAGRVAQLTQRTNQFNLTTRRYDVAELELLLARPECEVLWLDLKDRFGTSGIVGCGILRASERTAVIDTLLVSCRVIGRGGEALLVHALGKLARRMGARALSGEFIPSKRNAQVRDFYGRLGFAGPERADGMYTWRWEFSQGSPGFPDWLQVNDPEGLLE